MLETHRKELDVIAHGLIEFETLSGGKFHSKCYTTKIKLGTVGNYWLVEHLSV